jgi:hypothetical protein
MDEYNLIAQENTEAAIKASEREDDECLPPDPNAFPRIQEEDDEGLVRGLEEDLGIKRETTDEQTLRNCLYFALKDTRGEPGLSIEKVASQIMNAWSREEVASLVRELEKNLNI